MRIETNLKKIKEMGRNKEKENLRFRIFLKTCDLTWNQIDKLVHTLYKRISSKIDCAKCMNCCRQLKVILDDEDIYRLSTALDMDPLEFEELYVRFDENEGAKGFHTKLCPFLQDDCCQVYDSRPKECQNYPYLHKAFFTARLLSVIENYSICPIVFNVYEFLKREIWF